MKGIFITLLITLAGVLVINNYDFDIYNLSNSTDLINFKTPNTYICHYRSLDCMFKSGNCGIKCKHGDELTLSNKTACYPINNLVLVGFE